MKPLLVALAAIAAMSFTVETAAAKGPRIEIAKPKQQAKPPCDMVCPRCCL